MKFRFPIIIIDEDYRSENTSGLGIRALAQAIEAEGFEVVGVTSYGDLSQFAQQQSRASAFILSIDDEEFTVGEGLDPIVLSLRNFIGEVRRKNADVPIYVHGETKTSRHLPNDILRELHGFIHMFEDTPEFVARHIIREAKSYLEGVQPPFFKALLDYAEDGSYSWHCPGHSGGVAFLKSPVGQMYHQFYGENMLRADAASRAGAKIGLEGGQNGIENGDAWHADVAAFFLKLFGKIRIDQSIKNDAGRFFQIGDNAVDLRRCADQRMDMFDCLR